LGGIFVGSAAGLGGWYQWRQAQIAREAQNWKTQGFAAAQIGDAPQAIVLLGQYLRRMPNDAQALEAFARAIPVAQQGDQPQARKDLIFALQELLKLQSGRDDVRRQLLDLYVENDDTSQAITLADALLVHSPADTHVLALKAASLMSQCDWPRALAMLQDWTGRMPLDVEAQCALLVAMKQSQVPAAQILQRTVDLRTSHREDARFKLLEGFALRLTNLPSGPDDKKTAADWLRSAATDAPPLQDAKFVRALVDQLDQMGMFDESLDALRRAAAVDGAEAALRRDLGRRLWEINQWDAALPLLAEQSGVSGRAGDQALGLQGMAFVQKGMIQEMSRVRALLAGRPRDLVAAGWCAALDQAAFPEQIDPKTCAEACRQAIGCDAANVYLACFLAQAYARLGETDLALTLLNDVCARNRTWIFPAHLRAQMLLSEGRAAAALDMAQEARWRCTSSAGPRNDIEVALTLASALDAQLKLSGDRDAAQIEQLKHLLGALDADPAGRNSALGIELGLLSRTGQRALAQERLRQVLKEAHAPDADMLLHWAEVSRANHLDLEDACLEKCATEHGITPRLAYAQAALLQRRASALQGRQLLDEARKKSLHPEALAWQIAQAQYLDLTHDASAAAAWEAIAQEQASNAAVQLLAAASPVVQHDREVAQRTIQRLREATGSPGVAWRLAQAHWLLDDPHAPLSSAQQAAALLSEALRSVPDSPQAHWLRGRALWQMKILDGAVEELRNANTLDPQNVPILLDLAQLQVERGETDRAMQTLQSLPDPRCVVAQAQLLVDQGHLREAAKLVKTLDADRIEQINEVTLQKLQNLRTRLQEVDRPAP
jgi:tetratricopeptide (TPR) repeat protein